MLGPGDMGDLGALRSLILGAWVKGEAPGLKVLSSGQDPRSKVPGQEVVGRPEVPG